jgi:uncharacterized membrane protein
MYKIISIVCDGILARLIWVGAGIFLAVIGLFSPNAAANAIRQASKVI